MPAGCAMLMRSLPLARRRPSSVQVAAPPPAAAPAAAAPAAGWRRQRQQQRLQQRAAQQLRQLQPPSAAAVEAATTGIQIEDLTYEEGCYMVQGCLLTPASPDVVYQVLTDYEALPRVFHNVETSSVQMDAGTGQKQLVQTCKWAFLVFSGTFVTELNVREDPALRQLTFSLIHSAFMKEFLGSWDVRRGPDGLTEARHRLSVRPAVAPPKKIGEITCKIFRKQVVGLLEDLEQELSGRRG